MMDTNQSHMNYCDTNHDLTQISCNTHSRMMIRQGDTIRVLDVNTVRASEVGLTGIAYPVRRKSGAPKLWWLKLQTDRNDDGWLGPFASDEIERITTK